jgi:hypothetical protein
VGRGMALVQVQVLPRTPIEAHTRQNPRTHLLPLMFVRILCFDEVGQGRLCNLYARVLPLFSTYTQRILEKFFLYVIC